jgi:hypothetical protein
MAVIRPLIGRSKSRRRHRGNAKHFQAVPPSLYIVYLHVFADLAGPEGQSRVPLAWACGRKVPGLPIHFLYFLHKEKRGTRRIP